MTFATYEDVAVLMGRDLNAAEQAAVTASLLEAEEAVRVYTGQTFVPESATFRGFTRTGAVMLPKRPVVAITAWSYFADGVTETAGDVADLTRVGNVLLGLPIETLVEVEYDAGYAAVPETIRGIVTRSALRQLTNLSHGGTAEGQDTPWRSSALITLSDKAILDAYKRPAATTIFMRP